MILLQSTYYSLSSSSSFLVQMAYAKDGKTCEVKNSTTIHANWEQLGNMLGGIVVKMVTSQQVVSWFEPQLNRTGSASFP